MQRVAVRRDLNVWSRLVQSRMNLHARLVDRELGAVWVDEAVRRDEDEVRGCHGRKMHPDRVHPVLRSVMAVSVCSLVRQSDAKGKGGETGARETGGRDRTHVVRQDGVADRDVSRQALSVALLAPVLEPDRELLLWTW